MVREFHTGEIRSCGRHNVRKQKEVNNGEQYIALDIYLHINCLEKREIFIPVRSANNKGGEMM